VNDDAATQALIRGVQTGDRDAAEALFQRYLPRVGRMVALALGVPRHQLPADAEDVVQDAILRALRALPTFEVRSSAAFAAWLARIVENCVSNHRRDRAGPKARALWQRYGDLDLSESFFPGHGDSPSRLVAGAEADARIEQTLLGLAGLYRRALSLRFVGGLSHAEIAQELGRTESNARKIVQRGVDMLRAAIPGT